MGFYDHLENLWERYDLPDENIYNMDEKGIQLRMGRRVHALVNHHQKTVHQVEDANHELVMIIECIYADGTAIHPYVVFKGTCWTLEWGWDNPCNVRWVMASKQWESLLMPIQVYPTHLRAGLTRSCGLHGLSETLSLKQLKRIIVVGLKCSFWMAIIYTLHTVSASLQRSTTSLCCACLHTLLITFSHAMWESLGPLILLGMQRSIKHPPSGYQSGKQIYLPTMLELIDMPRMQQRSIEPEI